MLGSIVFYLFIMPMVGSMVIVSTSILSFFYMYLSFAILNGVRGREIFKKSSYAAISTVRMIGTIALGLCFSLILITSLFKLMLWPNVLTIGITGLAGVGIALALSIWKYLQSSQSSYLGIILRSILFLIIGFTTLFVPKYAVLEHQYAEHPDYIEAFKARDQNPTDPKYIEKLEEERLKILEEEMP